MEYNVRAEDFEGNVLNIKTTPKQAGLGNVKNYPINSSIDANSDEEYASTSMVAKVREEKADADNPILQQLAYTKGLWDTLYFKTKCENAGILITGEELNEVKEIVLTDKYIYSKRGEQRLPEGTNLDTILVGKYSAFNISNPPIGYDSSNNHFLVDIFPYIDTNYITQRIIDVRSNNIFFRSRVGGIWKEWEKISYTSTYSLQQKVEQELLQLELEALNG